MRPPVIGGGSQFCWRLGGRDPYWKPEDLLDAELIALWIGHHDVLGPWLLDLLEYSRAQFAQPGDLGAPVLCPQRADPGAVGS